MIDALRCRMCGYMAALFIAGFITGASVMFRTAPAPQTLKIGRTNEIAAAIREKLGPLQLSAEQREKFDPMIKKTSEDLELFHLECLQRCSAAVDKLHDDMSRQLTPEQQEKMKLVDENRRAALRAKFNYPPEPVQAAKP
jgi:hypothetical protein